MNNEMKNLSDQGDREFIAGIRKAWGRPELSPAEAARFDRALRERLEGQPRHRWVWAAALAAAAAVIALVLIVPGVTRSRRRASRWWRSWARHRRSPTATA